MKGNKAKGTEITNDHKKSLDLFSVSIEQGKALGFLLTGMTDGKAAEKVGVARETVTRWRLYHPAFKAKLNELRRDLWKSSIDRLRNLIPAAMDAIEETLTDKDNPSRWKCGIEILKAGGLHTDHGVDLAKVGSTDPEGIIQEAIPDPTVSGFDGILKSLEGPDYPAKAKAARENEIARLHGLLAG